jgi:hypothetical protein
MTTIKYKNNKILIAYDRDYDSFGYEVLDSEDRLILVDSNIISKNDAVGMAQDRIDTYVEPCDQCNETMINGVRCHEIGCPNSNKGEINQ